MADDTVRILSIDDERLWFETIRDLLDPAADGTFPYTVDWAPSAEQGLTALASRPYDVCLVDNRLDGDATGIDLIERAIANGVTTPFVFLTADNSRGVERQALKAGAADHLVKGELNPDNLHRAIQHAIEKARSLEALRERDRQFRALFQSALDGMIIYDSEGRYLDANEAALRLLGVTQEQLKLLRVGDLSPPETSERAPQVWRELLEKGKAEGEARIVRPDGDERLVEYRMQANFVPGRHLSVFRDVSARRDAERQRARLAALVESAADAIEWLSLDGTIEYWSPSAARIYGFPRESVVGRPKRSFVPPDTLAEFDEMFARAARGEALRNLETKRMRADGSTFTASVTVSPVLEAGRIVALSVITRDVTEQKKLEAYVAQTDRMASVGVLAAGVAHEINNPLAALMVNLELLSSGLDPREHEPLKDAREAAQHIRQVVKDLKLFSRRDDDAQQDVDVARVLDSTLRMAWNELRHRARLVKDYASAPPVRGSEARLGQVFLNLVVNAAQSIDEGHVERNEIRIAAKQQGARLVVEISDTGCGMSPETLQHVFEPFFTTKPAGVGTGLGLPICRRIVDELGGSIDIQSELGRGTTVRLSLPVAQVSEEVAAPARAAAPPTARRGRVLVIDDDALVSRAVERTLAGIHDVVGVSSAADALEKIRAGARFDVILCDMMMPHMTGVEFYEELRRISPAEASRVIFLTGGAFTAKAREFLDRVSNQRVDKPFDPTHLRALVSDRIAAT